MNHHKILGVRQSADASEIKRAYHLAAKELHPDHSDSPEAAEAFARLKEAYEVLSNATPATQEPTSTQKATAKAAAATAHAAFHTAKQQEEADETARIQALDEKVRQSHTRSVFSKTKEPAEVRKHRKKLKTNERRLRGLY